MDSWILYRILNMKEVRCAIIGSGFIAMTHAEALKYDKRAKLVAIAGGTRAPNLAQNYGVTAEPCIDKLLSRHDIDAVFICTPHHLHKESAGVAARKGKHILVEKPMATTVEDCNRMIKECHRAKVNLMVGHFQRFRKTNVTAYEVIREGKIGKVRMVNDHLIEQAEDKPWQNLPESRGFLLGYGVHAIDRLCWWFQDEVEYVSAWCRNLLGKMVEDSSMVLLEFRRGGAALLVATNASPIKPVMSSPGAAGFKAVLYGEKGILEVDAYGEVRLTTNSATATLYTLPKWNSLISPERIDAYAQQDREFISSIIEHRPPAITGADGRSAVAIALAAYKSSETGKKVRLKL